MKLLDDIAVFVVVVDNGSFTAAAEHLSMSKSVISKYVSRLEENLGARLLNRTTRRLSLTEAGRMFYDQARQGLSRIEDARSAVSRLQEQPRGNLRVNAPMSFGILHVAPALPEFLERYPDLTVDLAFDDRKIDPVKAGYDVSIRISDLPDSSLIARRVAPCRHVVVASPDYLHRHSEPQGPADLEQHHVITYQYQDSHQVWHFQTDDNRPVSVAIMARLKMNNSLAIRAALIGGAGISRIPTFVVGDDVAQGRLKTVLTRYRTLEVSVHLVYAHRHHLAPKVRAFVDYFAERFDGVPYWDAVL